MPEDQLPNQWSDDWQTNRRLILAAPDLLAACQAMLTWCTENDEWVNGADLHTLAEQIVPQIAAAIVKATGGQA